MENEPTYIQLIKKAKTYKSTNSNRKHKQQLSSGGTRKRRYKTKKRKIKRKRSKRKRMRGPRFPRSLHEEEKVLALAQKQKKNLFSFSKIEGGNIDDPKSVDFNGNDYDKKQVGGDNTYKTSCPDPNFSVYNTSLLRLFPYKPM